MEELLDTYKDYDPSDRCYLDGRYFNEVLANYEGLVRTPLVIHIQEHPRREHKVFKHHQHFEIHEKSGPEHLHLKANIPELVRVIIEVDRFKEDEDGDVVEHVIRHSSLLIFDAMEKKVYRFDPMKNYKYHDIIGEYLQAYVDHHTDDYDFEEFDHHPEHVDKKCKDKGMCVAFVIKAAVMYALGDDLHFSKDTDDIKRFAAAVEDLYSPIQGEPDIEFRGGGGHGGGGHGGGGHGGGGHGGHGGDGGWRGGGWGGDGLGLGLGLATGAIIGGDLAYGGYGYPGYVAPPYVYDPYLVGPYGRRRRRW
jgi:hypothetical protein